MAPPKRRKQSGKPAEPPKPPKFPPVWTPESGNIALGRMNLKSQAALGTSLYPCIVTSFDDEHANVSWIKPATDRAKYMTGTLLRSNKEPKHQLLFAFKLLDPASLSYQEAHRLCWGEGAPERRIITRRLLHTLNPWIDWNQEGAAKLEVDSAILQLAREPTSVQMETYEEFFLRWTETSEPVEEFKKKNT